MKQEEEGCMCQYGICAPMKEWDNSIVRLLLRHIKTQEQDLIRMKTGLGIMWSVVIAMSVLFIILAAFDWFTQDDGNGVFLFGWISGTMLVASVLFYYTSKFRLW